MHRMLGSVVVASLLAFALAACGGYSEDEATTKCDMQRKAVPSCINDAAYQQCLDCYQSCGQDCAIAESCPSQFICSE